MPVHISQVTMRNLVLVKNLFDNLNRMDVEITLNVRNGPNNLCCTGPCLDKVVDIIEVKNILDLDCFIKLSHYFFSPMTMNE